MRVLLVAETSEGSAQHGIRLNAIAPGPFATKGAQECLNPGPSFRRSRTRCNSLHYGSLNATTSTRSMAGGAVNRSSP